MPLSSGGDEEHTHSKEWESAVLKPKAICLGPGAREKAF